MTDLIYLALGLGGFAAFSGLTFLIARI